MYRADFAEYNGKIPFLEFLRSLSDDEQAEILAAIDKLLELKNSNNRISEKLSKYIHDGFFELRVRHQNKISRSIFFYFKEKRIIFTNGFIKKSEKTPNSEIIKAIKIRENFIPKL